MVLAQIHGPPNATLQQMQTYADQDVRRLASKLPEYEQMFQITGAPTVNQGFGGVLFKPWEERKRSAHAAAAGPAAEVEQDRRLRSVAAFQFPPLPGSQGLPDAVRHHDHRAVPEPQRGGARRCSTRPGRAACSISSTSDLKLDKPQATVEVDRDMVRDARA